jgi:hypothetical protein
MKYKILLSLFFSLAQIFLGLSQLQKHVLIFSPTFGNSELHLNDAYYRIGKNDSIQLETVKLYISNIEFLHKDSVVWREKNSFHLLNVSDANSLTISLDIPASIEYSHLAFNIGIDSITNVSGALGGDLDPTNGMYWTWQSGYINMKIEGKSNLCQTRNNEFQFHLGGYQNQDNALNKVFLRLSGKNKMSYIQIDIEKWLKSVDLSKQNHIMSPGQDAVLLSGKLIKMFTVTK